MKNSVEKSTTGNKTFRAPISCISQQLFPASFTMHPLVNFVDMVDLYGLVDTAMDSLMRRDSSGLRLNLLLPAQSRVTIVPPITHAVCIPMKLMADTVLREVPGRRICRSLSIPRETIGLHARSDPDA